VKTIIVKDAARLLHGKSAILNPVTGMDSALVGEDWQAARSVPVRQTLTAIKHLGGRHESRVGAVVEVEDLNKCQMGHVQYLEMYKVMSDELSAEELAAIGYESTEAFEEAEHLGSREMWLIHVQHVPSNTNTKSIN
jgi:hypothetical protein